MRFVGLGLADAQHVEVGAVDDEDALDHSGLLHCEAARAQAARDRRPHPPPRFRTHQHPGRGRRMVGETAEPTTGLAGL